MLSQNTINIVKSTVPVLEVHGEAITKRFYEMMFNNHPELLNIFNHANQKQGRQQKALANTVYAAAKYIDNLEAIVPVVTQIAHKHRSLGIQAEHYPIVGKHLILAIKDVLKDAATEEIISAWEEAYGVIAEVFINVEADMYQQTEQLEGGWKGFRRFIVDRMVKENNVITSFYLKPEDGGKIATYEPGQYISIQLKIPGEKYTHIRQYSLSDSPNRDYYRISVKEESGNGEKPDGIVSNYLHNHVKEGEILNVSAPAGEFVLDTSKQSPIVLLSGGVGITPMISMLNAISENNPDRETTFIHAAINGEFHAMKEHVQSIASKHDNIRSFVVYERPTEKDVEDCSFDKSGFINLEWLMSILLSNQADFYFCGPVPFMKAIYHALKTWEVPDENIHYEFFGPAGSLEEQEKEPAVSEV